MLTHEAQLIGSNTLPECLNASHLPTQLKAAEAGRIDLLSGGKEYDLSGGHKVTLYEYPDGIKGAVVMLAGKYPGSGKVAINNGRTEKITLIEGEATLEVNGCCITLRRGAFAVVLDGDKYSLEGFGTLVVAVKDQKGGTTVIAERLGTPAEQNELK